MIVACELCGAIRLENGEWIESDLEAPALAMCPACLMQRKRDSAARYRQGERRVRSRPPAGPPEPGEDVFRGFREPKRKGD